MTRKVEPWAQTILAGATIDGNVLKLPGQLDRDSYMKINKVLVALGGKWDRKKGGHVFAFDPAELVGRAANEGVYTDRKWDLQFFETPAKLAQRMVNLSGLCVGETMLEPSAGHGRIVEQGHAAGLQVTAIEIDPINVAKLNEEFRFADNVTILQCDFLEWAPTREREPLALRFDAVVMNPPFHGGQDVEHILAAWRLLKHGGRLVAIIPAGTMTNSQKKFVAFRQWVADLAGFIEDLPDGSFKESGTGVNTALLVMDKP